jgi:hypothetical protein
MVPMVLAWIAAILAEAILLTRCFGFVAAVDNVVEHAICL